MANCRNCAAPLPPNAVVCEYCGSRNDVDLTEIHYNTTHDSDSPRPCPRCGIAMRTIDLKIGGKFLVDRCERCFGLFFDPGELDAVLEAEVTNVFEINRSRLQGLDGSERREEQVRYVKCPICGKMMNRESYGIKSGVVIDRCRDHGVWLDAGELRSLFEWAKAGGKLYDQKIREERNREAAQRVRHASAEPTHVTEMLQDPASPSYDTPIDFRDLCTVVRGVIDLFRR